MRPERAEMSVRLSHCIKVSDVRPVRPERADRSFRFLQPYKSRDVRSVRPERAVDNSFR